jgi:hypothetical protein
MSDENAIYFLSDCQLPLAFEKLSFRAYRNGIGRDLLFADILGQHPGCLILLGDLIGLGSSARAWEPVNAFLSAARMDRCLVHAIPGNHEYLMNAEKGMHNYIKSFGRRQVMGYCIERGSLAIVMLNSNYNHVLPDEMMWQQIWFGEKMNSLDKDCAIKSIIVCAHHPPYTNSKVISPDRQVQEWFVPRFEQSPKTRAFLSGHSHNLECFRGKSGKRYVVVGGGGGLAQPLRNSNHALNIEREFFGDAPSFFYSVVIDNGENISMDIHGFDRDFRRIKFTLF